MKNKLLVLITAVVILLPIIAGVILWNALPDSIAIHFDANGQADSWCSKGFAVFGLPAIILILHLICIFITVHDPKYENSGRKMQSLVLWICPVISVISSVVIYGHSLIPDFKVLLILQGFLGIVLIIVGNYLSKCHQNYTIGIKLPWTLNDSENWNATHRFAAKVWIIGGIAMIINVFFLNSFVSAAIAVIIVLLPVIYSYIFYKSHCK